RLAEATGRAARSVPGWRAALDALADWAQESGPVLLVLDEFQFLARESPDIGSILNVWWRERGERLPIFVVLSGSEVGFFEREVVGYSATTYGRRAGQLRLRPFSARDVALFVPRWSAEDRIGAYAVFGHMPYYLAQIRPEQTLAQNIRDLVLLPDGLLHEEARLLLDQELPNASGFFSILRAIAAGQTRVAQIAERTGIAGGSSRVSQMLDTLQRLWLVDKQLPITVANPERSRQSRYRIADPYLRFWFRFVLPSRDRLIDAAGAERHLQARVLRELDAVAIDDDGAVVAIGSCKWTDGPMDADELAKLDALAAHLADGRPRPARYCFSRGGFTRQLRAAARRDPDLRLVTPKQLFRAPA